ncbi:hypothetical protein CLAIMM_06958 isoform 2, partial [Cladophialophora immunda]
MSASSLPGTSDASLRISTWDMAARWYTFLLESSVLQKSLERSRLDHLLPAAPGSATAEKESLPMTFGENYSCGLTIAVSISSQIVLTNNPLDLLCASLTPV